jgi:hypothetical protein
MDHGNIKQRRRSENDAFIILFKVDDTSSAPHVRKLSELPFDANSAVVNSEFSHAAAGSACDTRRGERGAGRVSGACQQTDFFRRNHASLPRGYVGQRTQPIEHN